MPFIEIYHFDLEPERRSRAARGATAALAEAFGIAPEIITIYFLTCGPGDYAHAGALPAPPGDRRMFVKVHAFPRPIEKLRTAAALMTAAIAEGCAVDPEHIAIYFYPRPPEEAAHGGRLASDERTA